MSEIDWIRRSETIEVLENTDWYHQNANKDMVRGANSNEHQAWYKAEDVYKALESVPSAQPDCTNCIWDVCNYNEAMSAQPEQRYTEEELRSEESEEAE